MGVGNKSFAFIRTFMTAGQFDFRDPVLDLGEFCLVGVVRQNLV